MNTVHTILKINLTSVYIDMFFNCQIPYMISHHVRLKYRKIFISTFDYKGNFNELYDSFEDTTYKSLS